MLILAMLGAGCRVPKEAGLPDVKRMLDERGISTVRWRRGGDEDKKIDERVRDLLKEDLTLATATELALLNSPRIQSTYERLGVAQADVVQAGMLRNPTIAGHVGLPIGAGVLEWEASFAWDLLDVLLIPLKKRFAEADFRRVKLEVAAMVLDAVAEVRTAFLTVQASQQLIAMRASVLEAERVSMELRTRQHEAGNVSDLDLAGEQGLYAQGKLELADAEAQLSADREHLTQLLGLWGGSIDWRIGAPLPELPAEEVPLGHVESFAIAHRLDLEAATAQVDGFAAALRITRRTRFVNVATVGASVHRDADGPLTIGPTLSLELPIFDQKQAQIARLEAQLRAAQKLRDGLAVAIRVEVRKARARLAAQRAAVNFYRTTLLPLRERIVALSQEQYNAMLLGVYQVIQAKQLELSAYREYLERVRDYWIVRAELERAAGGSLVEKKEPPPGKAAANQGEAK